jgi:hypothetical protein
VEYFFLAELSRVLKEGVRDLNQAAERLRRLRCNCFCRPISMSS